MKHPEEIIQFLIYMMLVSIAFLMVGGVFLALDGLGWIKLW